MFQKMKSIMSKPLSALVFLAILGVATSLFSGWGVWRMAELSAEFKNHEDRMLDASVTLKEKVASFSKLTYDFLLQQDFDRQLMKEKQSNATRDVITQSLAALALTSDKASTEMVEAVRYNVTQFLSLTDKALEKAVEDGNATQARIILQDEAEPALKKAQDSLSDLIAARQKVATGHTEYLHERALMFIALLIGLSAMALTLIMMLQGHLKARPHKASSSALVPANMSAMPASDMTSARTVMEREREEQSRELKAKSLAALAIISRFSRIHRESNDLRKMVGGMQRYLGEHEGEAALDMPDADIKGLAEQAERIALTVGRIQNVNNQSQQFVDKLNDLMGNLQTLATEGNMVALNVTIEMAKLQAQIGSDVPSEKTAKLSDQIRAMATTAANITGKMAMALSQHKYAQEDFAKQVAELMQIKNDGVASVDRIRAAMARSRQNASTMLETRSEFEHTLPLLSQKVEELEHEIEQLQLFANDGDLGEVKSAEDEKNFKVISGRAA